MTTPIRESFEEFFAERQPADLERFAPQFTRYVPVTGWHVYGRLKIHNLLDAPSDSVSAKRLLEVLHLYFSCAESAAQRTGAVLLEMQGTIIHLLIPDQLADPTKTIKFSKAFIEGVYDKVKRKAGENFNGFAMAAYHGNAVIVRSNSSGVDSEVSLGNAANRPAKRLLTTPGVPAGHLSLPVVTSETSQEREKWSDLDLLSGASTAATGDDSVARQVKAAFEAPQTDRIFNFSRQPFKAGVNIASGDPIQTFAFCIKSDMDGFSKKVEDAWARGTVAELIADFDKSLKDADAYVKSFPSPIIPLPWAGDCSTLIFPSNSVGEYLKSRELLPISAAIAWNNSVGVNSRFGNSVSWAHAFAGIDVGNASQGNTLVASFTGSRRTFVVAVGPGVKWARDGEQSPGLRGGEIAVFRPDDLNRLDERLKTHFSEFGRTNFVKAQVSKLRHELDSVRAETIQRLGSVSILTTGKAQLPTPRPHGYK